MTKRPAPTGAGQERLPWAEAFSTGDIALSPNGIPYAKKSCVSYRPGHAVHWIQAKKSREPGQPIIGVSVVVCTDGLLDLHANDLHLTMWTHDPAALNHLLDGRARVQLRPSFHVLSVKGTLLSLATPDQRTPCLQDDDYLPATREKPPWSAPHGVRRGTTDLSLLSLGSRAITFKARSGADTARSIFRGPPPHDPERAPYRGWATTGGDGPATCWWRAD